MQKRGWNELKIEVLTHIKDSPMTTSKDLALALEIDIHNAGMILLRLYRQKLLERKRSHVEGFRKPFYHYTITARGERRQDYLAEKEVS